MSSYLIASLIVLSMPVRSFAGSAIDCPDRAHLELAYEVTVNSVNERVPKGGPVTLTHTIKGESIVRIEVARFKVENAPEDPGVPSVRIHVVPDEAKAARDLEIDALQIGHRSEGEVPASMFTTSRGRLVSWGQPTRIDGLLLSGPEDSPWFEQLFEDFKGELVPWVANELLCRP